MSGVALPFRQLASGGDYYPSPLHEEALARLRYLSTKGSGCGLLVGPGGCGKTLVLSQFAAQQRRGGAAVAAVSALEVDSQDLLLSIGLGWGASMRSSDDLQSLWKKGTDRLRELNLEQVPAVLLVDDLHQALPESAALIDRLQAFVEGNGPSLTLAAACKNGCQELLTSRFLARTQLLIELDTWTEAETGDFLQQWMARHVSRDQEFDEQAVAVLHELSEGVPRRIRRLAELSALAGGGGRGKVSEEVVRSAFHELISP